MKKNMKRARTLEALRMAIDFMKNQHHYTAEYCPTACCDECSNNNGGNCTAAKCIISFYDYNHNRLVGNWLISSSWWFECGLAKIAAEYFDIDIDHLMWGQTEKLLHKVRYIRIGERIGGIDDIGYWKSERGLEFDLYKNYNKLEHKRYIEKWYSVPEIDDEWRRGIF
jgi:hypothetical protein